MGVQFLLVGLTYLASGILGLLMLVVVVEVAAAMTLRRPGFKLGSAGERPITVVLVPAQNEEAVIGRCLASLKAAIPSTARILVIAHNCTDNTAQVAREMGVQVIERKDAGTGGKPDSVKAGLQALDSDPPDVVVIVDADCVVNSGAISALAEAAWKLNRPTMGAYVFRPPADANGMAVLSSLATTLKNLVRPWGLHSLSLPCLINGSGSAYPFSVLRMAPHGEGSIAEDHQLTVDLLRLGYPTVFVPEARIEGQLPVQQSTAFRQRRRWEHGHLFLALKVAPGLLAEGIRGLDKSRIAIALELLVPPLAFLVLLWLLTTTAALASALVWDSTGPLALQFVTGLIFTITVLAAWFWIAGVKQTLGAVGSAPRYLLWKLPLYGGYLRDRETRWIKTDRD